MYPSTLLIVAFILLVYPWLLRPRSGKLREPDERTPLLKLLWWINLAYCSILHRVRIEAWAPLPVEGPAILIANHTCGIDHLLLQAGTKRVLGFMIAQEYYDHRIYHPFCKLIGCIPVKRDGRDLSATRAAIRALKEGRVLPIFPEGRINPSSGRELGEIKQGAAFIAFHAKVPVVPAYIRGTPATNQIGESLTTPSSAQVIFGEPIDLSDVERQESDRDAIAEVTSRFENALLALRDRATRESVHSR